VVKADYHLCWVAGDWYGLLACICAIFIPKGSEEKYPGGTGYPRVTFNISVIMYLVIFL